MYAEAGTLAGTTYILIRNQRCIGTRVVAAFAPPLSDQRGDRIRSQDLQPKKVTPVDHHHLYVCTVCL